MFTQLLACTDGSPYGETACDYGLFLAKALPARLTALHVLDIRVIEGPLLADVSGMIGAAEYFASMPNFRNLMQEKGRAVCEGFATRAAAAGVDAACTVETGHPLHTILERHTGTNLLILGRRGENEDFGGELIGSIAERVVRRAQVPCLVTPAHFKPVTAILTATDGSPLGSKAVDAGADLAARLGATLTVLSVAEKVDTATARRTAELAVEATRIRLPGATPLVREGNAAESIVAAAAEVKADLIVMGAHSHSRVREWFVGCTTLRILADSALPALFVR